MGGPLPLLLLLLLVALATPPCRCRLAELRTAGGHCPPGEPADVAGSPQSRRPCVSEPLMLPRSLGGGGSSGDGAAGAEALADPPHPFLERRAGAHLDPTLSTAMVIWEGRSYELLHAPRQYPDLVVLVGSLEHRGVRGTLYEPRNLSSTRGSDELVFIKQLALCGEIYVGLARIGISEPFRYASTGEAADPADVLDDTVGVDEVCLTLFDTTENNRRLNRGFFGGHCFHSLKAVAVFPGAPRRGLFSPLGATYDSSFYAMSTYRAAFAEAFAVASNTAAMGRLARLASFAGGAPGNTQAEVLGALGAAPGDFWLGWYAPRRGLPLQRADWLPAAGAPLAGQRPWCSQGLNSTAAFTPTYVFFNASGRCWQQTDEGGRALFYLLELPRAPADDAYLGFRNSLFQFETGGRAAGSSAPLVRNVDHAAAKLGDGRTRGPTGHLATPETVEETELLAAALCRKRGFFFFELFQDTALWTSFEPARAPPPPNRLPSFVFGGGAAPSGLIADRDPAFLSSQADTAQHTCARILEGRWRRTPCTSNGLATAVEYERELQQGIAFVAVQTSWYGAMQLAVRLSYAGRSGRLSAPPSTGASNTTAVIPPLQVPNAPFHVDAITDSLGAVRAAVAGMLTGVRFAEGAAPPRGPRQCLDHQGTAHRCSDPSRAAGFVVEYPKPRQGTPWRGNAMLPACGARGICGCNLAQSTINCSGLGLFEIPPLPSTVERLDLSNNRILEVSLAVFRDTPLVALNMDGNPTRCTVDAPGTVDCVCGSAGTRRGCGCVTANHRACLPDLRPSFSTFTLSAWIRPTPGSRHGIDVQSNAFGNLGGASGQTFVFFGAGIDRATAGIAISAAGNGLSLYGLLETAAQPFFPPLLVYEAPDWDNGAWQHIAIVVRNSLPTLYVNGVAQHQGLQSPLPLSFVPRAFGASSPADFGAFAGDLDDVQVFGRELLGEEVAAIAHGAGQALSQCVTTAAAEPGSVNAALHCPDGFQIRILASAIVVPSPSAPCSNASLAANPCAGYDAAVRQMCETRATCRLNDTLLTDQAALCPGTQARGVAVRFGCVARAGALLDPGLLGAPTLGHWQFDANAVSDSQGLWPDGFLVGAVSTEPEGVLGSAVRFSGGGVGVAGAFVIPDLNPDLPAPTPAAPTEAASSGPAAGVVVAAVLVSALVVVALLCLGAWLARRSRTTKIGQGLSSATLVPMEAVDSVGQWQQPIEFGPDDIQIGGKLGSGAFATVCRGDIVHGPRAGTAVAIKQLDVSGPEARSTFMREARVMSNLRHPNLVALLGVCLKADKPSMVLEFMSGDLRAWLQAQASAPERRQDLVPLLDGFASNVAAGCAYLESQRVIHRDLAARNVLLDHGLATAKLADLGLARELKDDDYYRKTSRDPIPLKWMAPEAIRDRKYALRSDVWSFGVVLWEMYSLGRTPYEGTPALSVFITISKGYRMPRPELASANMYQLMTRCWHSEPYGRPSFADLVGLLSDPDPLAPREDESCI